MSRRVSVRAVVAALKREQDTLDRLARWLGGSEPGCALRVRCEEYPRVIALVREAAARTRGSE